MSTVTPESQKPILSEDFERLGIPIGYEITRRDDQPMSHADVKKVTHLLTGLGHRVLDSGHGSYGDDPRYSCVLVEKSVGFADLLLLAEEVGYGLHLSPDAKNAMSGV